MRCSHLAAFGVLIAVAAPAFADIKTGFDMWNSGDYFGAVKEWRPAAIAGDPVAQFNLARAYQLGRGVPLDLKMAESWFGKAARQGHEPSRDNYGLVLFQNGDREAALPYLEEAAARGEPRAQYVLGTALFNGDMLKSDWVRAYALMTRASASGIGAASSSLAQMDKYIPLDQRQRGLALARAYETAASKPQLTANLISDTLPAGSVVASGNLPPSQAGAPPIPRPVEPKTPTKQVKPAKVPAPAKVASASAAPAVAKAVPPAKIVPKAVAERASLAPMAAAPSRARTISA